jgi:hyaluronan synthase
MQSTNRSHPARGWALVLSAAVILGFFSYVAWANLQWVSSSFFFLVLFFTFFASITGLFMVSGVFWRSFTHLPMAEGKIICIVPVYQEDSEEVHRVVWSIINQTRQPDAIYVVDDGSDVPIVGFDHPLVTWIRQDNAGKREAQANALNRHSADEVEFIFTVDSDSILDRDALSHLLRSMSWRGRKGKRVEAATGMIYTGNRTESVITRLTDINIASSCLQFSGLRSWLGIQTPTSGAIALYRADMIYANLDDYLSSGTMGDDRRLSFYALLRGQVVRVNEAVVETHLPADLKGFMKQRMRWAKSAFLGAPFVATNFGPKILFFYFYPLVFAITWPFTVVVLSTLWIRFGVPVLLYGIAFWWIVSMCMNAIYVIYRPSMSLREKGLQWGLGLFYPVYGLFLRTSAYWALFTLKDQSWATRGSELNDADADDGTQHMEPLLVHNVGFEDLMAGGAGDDSRDNVVAIGAGRRNTA